MHDGTYYQLNTVNYDGIFHTWDSFKIEKILVGQQLGFYMNFLTIFIVLNIILLTVLLFVTINSVIDDLVGVILMFKALGYKTSQINFMICGSYIMASLVIFVVSYFIMQLVYYFATNLIWSKATILINMSWDWANTVDCVCGDGCRDGRCFFNFDLPCLQIASDWNSGKLIT
jgi:hypothetical protein